MKARRRVGLVMVTGVAAPLLLAVGIAVTVMPSGTSQAAVQLAQSRTENPQRQTDESDQSSSLQERITQRQAAQQTRLTAAQRLRITSSCQAAQERLETYGTRLQTTQKNRVNAYDKVLDRLRILTGKLKDQLDTAELEAVISSLDSSISGFEEKMTDYRQVINDLIDMNCTDNPEGFRASLEAAKDQRLGLVRDSATIRKQILETARPLLQAARDELRSKLGNVIN